MQGSGSRLDLTVTASKRKWKHLEMFGVFLPESQGQDLVVTVSYAPYSRDSGNEMEEYCKLLDRRAILFRHSVRYEVQGYLAHKKTSSSRTLS